MTRWVLHIDMDQFIAAVELLRRPELVGLPIVVGGDGDPAKRAVVSTASYEARVFGVRSGMPLRVAARRCPDAVFLPVDHELYEAASAAVMDALCSFDAVVEVMGWDEAFLEFHTDDPEAVAHEVRNRVLQATGLQSSVGIGDNKLQAKLATGFAKPAGVFRLTGENWFNQLGDQPTNALWGVGPGYSKRLAAMGIVTVTDLAAADPATLAGHFGPTIGPWLGSLGRGVSYSPVTDEARVARGRSKEVTYQQDIDDWGKVESEVARLARLAASEGDDDIRAVMRVHVKVRYAPFFTRLKSRKLPAPTTDLAVIERGALEVLDAFNDRRAVRLLGVRVEFEMP